MVCSVLTDPETVPARADSAAAGRRVADGWLHA